MMRHMQHGEAKPHNVGLSIGSNLGDCLKNLQAARDALAPYFSLTACSPVYEAVAAYVADQPRFYNAVLLGTTKLDPIGFLYTVKDIEIDLGRTPTFHYGPRVIDIDILFYDDLILQTTELTLPHPRMAERLFVLGPLAAIAPDWQHPLLKQTAQQLLETSPDQESLALYRESM